jgi:hypothetical protein
MRKGASRIAVGAFSRGRWYPNTPRTDGNSICRPRGTSGASGYSGGEVCHFRPPQMRHFHPPLTTGSCRPREKERLRDLFTGK